MDQDILKKIYGKTTDLNKSVVSVDGTVTKLLKLRKEEKKEDDKLRKAERSEKRRKKQLEKRQEKESIKKDKGKLKEEKKKKGGILEMLQGALGSVLGGLGSALTSIGGLLMTSLGGLGIGAMLTSALSAVAPILIAAVGAAVAYHFRKEIMDAWKKNVVDPINKKNDELNKFIQKHFYGRDIGEDTLGVEKKYTEAFNKAMMADPKDKDAARKEQAAWRKLLDMMRVRDAMLHQMNKAQQDVERELTDREKADLKRQAKTVEQFKDEQKKKLEDLKENIKIKQEQIDKLYDKDKKKLIPPVMRQTGGVVPTLLEPGEKVFMPGQWDESIRTLNSIIPRFQSGGVVEHYHGDPTRPEGYDRDGHGLESNAHDHFAFKTEAIRKAVQARLATGQTPSGRKYQIGSTTGGTHAPNSYHYSGQAFDIPWSQFGSGPLGERDYQQSKVLAKDIKGILKELGEDPNWTGGTNGKNSGGATGEGPNHDPNHAGGAGGGGLFGGIKDVLSGFGEVFEGVKGLFAGLFEGFGELGLGDLGGQLLQGFGGGIQGVGGLGAGLFDGLFGSPAQAAGNEGGGAGHTKLGAGQAGDMMSGAKMIMNAGVPKRGAAYLAGNIQQESSWNGQRDWGQVMGDGTSRNGGLVSWASWSDDPARLGKIEKHLGKNIKEASDGEQINAMLWEMKRDYPKAYGIFMNPKSSDADLRWASKRYWGYGHEGPRYSYAQQVLENMKQTGGPVRRQQGGIVNVSGNNSTLSRMKAAQEKFAEGIAEAANPAPIVVFEDMPPPNIAQSGHLNNRVPDLPDGPSTIQAAEYFYKINLGGNI